MVFYTLISNFRTVFLTKTKLLTLSFFLKNGDRKFERMLGFWAVVKGYGKRKRPLLCEILLRCAELGKGFQYILTLFVFF